MPLYHAHDAHVLVHNGEMVEAAGVHEGQSGLAIISLLAAGSLAVHGIAHPDARGIVAVAAGLQSRPGLVHHAHETPLFRHGEIGSTVLSHLISGFLDGILGTEDLDLAGEKFRQFHAVGLLGGREASVAAFTAPGVSRRAGISAPCNFPRPTREPAYPARIRTTVPPASHDSNGDIPRPTRATFLPRGHLPPPYIQL